MGGIVSAVKSLFSGPPKAPNTQQIIAQQTAANKQATTASQTASQTNQVTPYGNLTYSNTGEKDQYGNPYKVATQTLSPDQQAILDALETSQKDIGGTANQLIKNTFDRYTEAPNLTGATDNIVNDRILHMLDYITPFNQTEIDQLDNRLRNQGLVPGTPGYDNAMRTLRDNQKQSEQKYIADIQPQAFQQAVQEYGLPLDVATQLMQASRPASLNQNIVNTPLFNQNPVNVGGIATSNYQNQLASYNSQMQMLNSLGSGLFGQNSMFGPAMNTFTNGVGNIANNFVGGLFA